MPQKDPKKRQEYQTKYMREVWYPKNKKKHMGYVKKLKTRIKEYLEDYKKERSCIDCGFPGKDFPQVLEFDHLGDKKFEIGSWARFALSLEKVQIEMAKCELVCANCHRIRTVTRLQ